MKKQIEEKAYARSLRAEGYGRIHRFGITFYKKTCEVAMVRFDRFMEIVRGL